MSIYRVFTNSGAQIVAKILTILIGIATVKLLTQTFGVEGFGLYAKVHNYAAIFAAIADLGLFTITVREINVHQDDKAYVSRLISHVTGLRFVLGIGLGVLAVALAFVLPGYHDPVTIFAIVITQIFVIFGLVYSSYLSFLQARLRSEFSLVSSSIGRFVAFGLMVWVSLGLVGLGLDTRLILIFVAALVGNIIMTVMLGIYTKKFDSIRMSFSFAYFAQIVRENIWYIGAIFFSTIFLRVDVLMLSLLMPASSADEYVGYYSVSIKLVEVAIYFGVIILNSFLPLYITNVAKANTTLFTDRFLSFSILLVGGILFGGISTLFSEEIVTLLSDVSFVVFSAPTLVVVSWSVVFHYLGLFFSYQLITQALYRPLFWLNVTIFLINIALNLYLIREYQIYGAALASLISQFVFFLFGSLTYLGVFVSEQRVSQGQS